MTFTNKPKLLVCFHGILIYTRISGHILGIPEGKYVIDLFSDELVAASCGFLATKIEIVPPLILSAPFVLIGTTVR